VDAAGAVDVVAGCALEEGCARKKVVAEIAMLKKRGALNVMTTP
jgi:hypothetical protein